MSFLTKFWNLKFHLLKTVTFWLVVSFLLCISDTWSIYKLLVDQAQVPAHSQAECCFLYTEMKRVISHSQVFKDCFPFSYELFPNTVVIESCFSCTYNIGVVFHIWTWSEMSIRNVLYKYRMQLQLFPLIHVTAFQTQSWLFSIILIMWELLLVYTRDKRWVKYICFRNTEHTWNCFHCLFPR